MGTACGRFDSLVEGHKRQEKYQSTGGRVGGGEDQKKINALSFSLFAQVLKVELIERATKESKESGERVQDILDLKTNNRGTVGCVTE